MIKDYIDCSEYDDDLDYSGYEDVQVHWSQPVSASELLEQHLQSLGDNWINHITGKFTPYRKD
jgi:hypothetical protein